MKERSLLTAFAAATTFAGALLFAPSALAEPVRILVAAGSRQGLAAEHALKFADNDAQHVRDVMVSLGGVRKENAFYLSEPNREALFAAIEKAKKEAEHHRSDEVTLVFYFSGHGDRDALHLGGDRVLLTELSAKLAEVPAGLRIAVTDACRSSRNKGFAADEPFAISATMIPQAAGQVWLHASSDGEAAQESDDLQGAIFTQAWLSGLRGAADANGDARVTLDESFAFAQSQTLIRSAQSSGVLQKPEAVVSLRETAPVVVTQTTTDMATLALPRARDTHFLVYSSVSKSVLSELWSSPDRPLLLRLPPGRYAVQSRSGTASGVAKIAIAGGEERRLEPRDFTASPLDAVAQKGADPDKARRSVVTENHHELSFGYDAGFSGRTGLVQGPHATYAFAGKHLAFTLGGGADFTNRSISDEQESLTDGYGRIGAEFRIPLGRFTLRAGAGGRAGILVQTLTPNHPSVTASTATRNAFMLGPEAAFGARWAATRTWFADLGATGGVSFLRVDDVTKGISMVTLGLSLGAQL